MGNTRMGQGSEPRRSSLARRASILNLAYMILSIAAKTLGRDGMIVAGDAAATSANILAHGLRFRIGALCDLTIPVLFLLAAWALYVLLKPVGGKTALLFLILNACGGAIYSMSSVFLFATIPFANGAGYLASFSAEQLHALTYAFVELRDITFMGSQLCYGAWVLPLGYLVFKSGFLPKAIGILLMVDCFSVFAYSLQRFLISGYKQSMSYPFFAISFAAEILGLTLWLVFKGASDAPAPEREPRA